MLKLAVRDIEGKEVEDITLDPKIFDGKVRKPTLYQAVNMYLANKRRGTAETKTIGEVSGGGKKPWRQKGTGRARVGSTRNPLWRGGGTVFGPHPRNFSYTLPSKIKKLSLKDSINSKINDKEIIILQDLSLKEPKTKHVNKLLKKLKIKDKCTIVFNKKENDNFLLAARNIEGVSLKNAQDINAYEILASGKLLFTKAALSNLIERIQQISKDNK